MNYLIISLKHGTADTPVFWRPDNAGYTETPWAAGIYPEEVVRRDPDYYNDGYNTVAVPYTSAGLDSIGFKCNYDPEKIKQVHKTQKELLKRDIANH